MFTTRFIYDGVIVGRLTDIGHVELMGVLMAAARLGMRRTGRNDNVMSDPTDYTPSLYVTQY